MAAERDFRIGDIVTLRVHDKPCKPLYIHLLLKPRCTCPRVVCEAGLAHLPSCLRGLYLNGGVARLAILGGSVSNRMRAVPESFLAHHEGLAPEGVD